MISFKEFINEKKGFDIKEFEKLTSLKRDKSPMSVGRHEHIYFLKDKSSLVIIPGKEKAEYYDSKLNFVKTFSTPKSFYEEFKNILN